jgi:hypothetical protein
MSHHALVRTTVAIGVLVTSSCALDGLDLVNYRCFDTLDYDAMALCAGRSELPEGFCGDYPQRRDDCRLAGREVNSAVDADGFTPGQEELNAEAYRAQARATFMLLTEMQAFRRLSVNHSMFASVQYTLGHHAEALRLATRGMQLVTHPDGPSPALRSLLRASTLEVIDYQTRRVFSHVASIDSPFEPSGGLFFGEGGRQDCDALVVGLAEGSGEGQVPDLKSPEMQAYVRCVRSRDQSRAERNLERNFAAVEAGYASRQLVALADFRVRYQKLERVLLLAPVTEGSPPVAQ